MGDLLTVQLGAVLDDSGAYDGCADVVDLLTGDTPTLGELLEHVRVCDLCGVG